MAKDKLGRGLSISFDFGFNMDLSSGRRKEAKPVKNWKTEHFRRVTWAGLSKIHLSILINSASYPQLCRNCRAEQQWTLPTPLYWTTKSPHCFQRLCFFLFFFFFLNQSYMFHESQLHSRITSARRENKSVVLVKPGFSLQVQKQYHSLVVNTFWTKLLKISSVKKYTHLRMSFFVFDHKQELREGKRNGL